MPDLKTAFPVLSREKFGLVDAGARDGIPELFREIAPVLQAVGFEPDAEECDRLNRSGAVRYLPWALGNRNGATDLQVCRSKGASSFYQPNRRWLERFPDPDRYDVLETRSVPARTLDSLRTERAEALPARVDFLKIDVQGAELDVLQGARQTLDDSVVGIEVEVEFARLYESQPLFRDVDAFLSERGFTLFKLRRKSWVRANCQKKPQISAGQLVAADALYLKDPLTLEQERGGADAAHQIEALVLTSVLYDLHDFALEIVADPRFAPLLQADAVRAWILQRSNRMDYQPNGSGQLAAWLKIAGEISRVKAGLGNLYEWSRRRSWGRADSDKDFYTRTR